MKTFMSGDYMQQKKIIGTGFSGLDIIRTDNKDLILPGGTCANVLAVLASLGWSTKLFKAQYNDEWNTYVNRRLGEFGVDVNEYASSNEATPKVIQINEGNDHRFYTVCPKCNRRLIEIRLPTINIISTQKNDVEETNVFFTDRISSGIKFARKAANAKLIWTFYEPNSNRSYAQLLNNASEFSIVKFSSERISSKVANKLKNDLSLKTCNTRLLIVTMGNKGLSFSLRTSTNLFSEWHNIDAINSTETIDTSGAGDWLTAGFLDVFIDNYPKVTSSISYKVVRAALQNGQILSQTCCKYMGALGALDKSDNMLIPIRKWTCNYCLSDVE